jgi:hypothetical protein
MKIGQSLVDSVVDFFHLQKEVDRRPEQHDCRKKQRDAGI